MTPVFNVVLKLLSKDCSSAAFELFLVLLGETEGSSVGTQLLEG
jgi:hypothetical protein